MGWAGNLCPRLGRALLLGVAGGLLLLDGGQGEGVALAAGHGLPLAVVSALVPGQGSNPRLDVVVHAQLDVVGVGDARRGVCDLVLWTLVLDGELASVIWLSRSAMWSVHLFLSHLP